MTDVNAMTEKQFKTHEDRLRRMAKRQGMVLLKSRTRDERALTFGGYMIADQQTNGVVVGGSPHDYSMQIDEVEKFLRGDK